ncbi:hypothetical protein E8F11_17655 [Pseudomonas sp. BN417]|uniref:hypothetical protein n=1 Tax=unclassified Pseudomonas TaxID=196821 RepID=UPI0009F37E0A|nr:MULTISPECIES: hypothetical protein [unclassified Pseudomonas]MDH4556969.1 hypothetical protein [Pseudomonas sp. BN417]
MNIKRWSKLITIAAFLVGCTTSQNRQVANIPLTPSIHNAGQIGQATLASAGKETALSIFISGVPSDTTRPVHIYTFIYSGTCKQPERTPAFEMNQYALAGKAYAKRGWTIYRSAPVKLSTLRTGGYSIVLRVGPADGNRTIFCGEIT